MTDLMTQHLENFGSRLEGLSALELQDLHRETARKAHSRELAYDARDRHMEEVKLIAERIHSMAPPEPTPDERIAATAEPDAKALQQWVLDRQNTEQAVQDAQKAVEDAGRWDKPRAEEALRAAKAALERLPHEATPHAANRAARKEHAEALREREKIDALQRMNGYQSREEYRDDWEKANERVSKAAQNI